MTLAERRLRDATASLAAARDRNMDAASGLEAMRGRLVAEARLISCPAGRRRRPI